MSTASCDKLFGGFTLQPGSHNEESDAASDRADGICCHRCCTQFTVLERKDHMGRILEYGPIVYKTCSSQSCLIPHVGTVKDDTFCEACWDIINKEKSPQSKNKYVYKLLPNFAGLMRAREQGEKKPKENLETQNNLVEVTGTKSNLQENNASLSVIRRKIVSSLMQKRKIQSKSTRVSTVSKMSNCIINSQDVLTPVQIANHRAERIAKEKQKNQSCVIKEGKICDAESVPDLLFPDVEIKSCGRGAKRKVAASETNSPGYLSIPPAIKISKSGDGAHLSWEAPQTTSEDIIEYYVYLVKTSATMRRQGDNRPTVSSNVIRLSSCCVYCGKEPSCTVSKNDMKDAYVDDTTKPAITFRIVAKNKKGYGPATVFRWLQDETNNNKPTSKKSGPKKSKQAKHEES